MKWMKNQNLPDKLKKTTLEKNPKINLIYSLVMLTLTLVILLPLLIYANLANKISSLENIIGVLLVTILTVTFSLGARNFWLSDTLNAHKVKWDSDYIYIKNNYVDKIRKIPWSKVKSIEFYYYEKTEGRKKVINEEEANNYLLRIEDKFTIGGMGTILSPEIGVKIKKYWENKIKEG